MDETRERQIKRLLYRARYRGFREADFLIGGFAQAHLGAMTDAELAAFDQLLEENDHDLFAWIKGGVPAPERLDRALLAAMRAYDVSSVTAPGGALLF